MMKRLIILIIFIACPAWALDIDQDNNDAVDVAYGGTNATTASGARANLGLAIGSDIQAYNANLANIAAITPVQGDLLYHNGTAWVALGYGTDGYLLKTQGVGKNPAWTAATGDVATDTIWDAAGDLVQGTGANTAAKLTKGAEGTILRAGASSNAYTTSTFADTYAAGTLLGAASANTVAGVTTISLDDSAAQFYNTAAPTKLVKVDASGLTAGDTAVIKPVGNYTLTYTLTGNSGVTLPTTGTLATLGGAETFSGVKTFSAAPIPSAATIDIGTTAAEWRNLYLTDSAVIYGQADQSNSITSSATGWTFAKPITVSDVTNDNYLKITNNSGGRAPTASVYELYPDAGLWKLNENGTEYTIQKAGACTALASDGAATTLTVGSTNCYTLTVDDNEDQTITFSGAGYAGQEITIIFTTAGTSDEVITFHATLVSSTGTLTLGTTASRYYTIRFISNGTHWYEVSRTGEQT